MIRSSGVSRRRSLSIVLAAVFVLTLLLGACGVKNDVDTVKLRVGEVTRSIFYAPLYVAFTQGMFDEEKLDVTLIETPGGDKAMTALLSGQVDITLVGSETSIYVYQQGATDPVINFAQLTQTDGTFLVGRSVTQADFTWEKLQGSVMLGQRKGGMPQMAV
jgi:NitT/TauT family transport system substrate-binding protein